MGHRLFQMCLRVISFMLMIIAMYFNAELQDLTTAPHFLMSGVYGAFIVITMGLLIETALHIDTDVLIEALFLATAVFLNVSCSVISYMEFQTSLQKKESMVDQSVYLNKAFVTMFGALAYGADLVFSLCYVER